MCTTPCRRTTAIIDYYMYSVYSTDMNTRELVKCLKALGFEEIGGKKHIKFKHPDGRWTSLSMGSHEISIDLLKKIEQQIGEPLREDG